MEGRGEVEAEVVVWVESGLCDDTPPFSLFLAPNLEKGKKHIFAFSEGGLRSIA